MSDKHAGELVARVLTWVVGIPLLLWLVWVGGRLFLAVLAVGAGVMLWEYRRLVAAGGRAPALALLVPAGLGVAALVGAGHGATAAGWAFLAVAVELGLGLREAPEESLLRRAGAVALGALYIGVPFGLAVRLRAASFWVLAGGLVLVFANDTLAYLVGVNVGRHKLAPRVSPKKSVEGAAAGLAGSVIAAVAVRGWLAVSVWEAVAIGLAVGVAAQVGDLVESALKREAGVKDSGWVLPGHGGLLDRFDSSLLALPALYFLLRIL
jgi:phosphatidate cytidylyltransferase